MESGTIGRGMGRERGREHAKGIDMGTGNEKGKDKIKGTTDVCI